MFERAAAIWEMDYRIITDWPSADDTEKTIKQLGYLFVSRNGPG